LFFQFLVKHAYHTFYAVEHLLDLLLAALAVDAHPQGQSLATENTRKKHHNHLYIQGSINQDEQQVLNWIR
jgi:hypothetical protein